MTETVVLVHGLWTHGIVMGYLRRKLEQEGYHALCYSYPSVRLALADNVERLARFCAGVAAPRVHFLAHSLGGRVVLRALEQAGAAPARVVLMGTPLAGSYAGQRLAQLPGGRSALGRSMAECLEAPAALNGGCEVGVIAGRLPVGLGRLVAPGLPPPNDGAVAVAETRAEGMRDHIVLEVSHSGMLFSGAAARQACAFLRTGAFARS